MTAANQVPQFYGMELFEHYQRDGYLLVVTSDASSLRLEPGDFIVKRMWSTAVAPYVYNHASGGEEGCGHPNHGSPDHHCGPFVQ